MSAESGESGESNDAIDYNELPPEKRRELCGILENFGVFEGIGEISQAMSTYDATKHLRPNEELPAARVGGNRRGVVRLEPLAVRLRAILGSRPLDSQVVAIQRGIRLVALDHEQPMTVDDAARDERKLNAAGGVNGVPG